MPEIDEILSRLTERHHVSLQRFASHLHEERAWPGTLSYGTLLASKARNTLNKGSEGGFWRLLGEFRGNTPASRAVFPDVPPSHCAPAGPLQPLTGPSGGHPARFGPLRPCQPVSWPSAVSRLPKPKSSARRSVFFASPR